MALEDPPLYEAVVVASDLKHPLAKRLPTLIMGYEWLRWLSTLTTAVSAAPDRRATVALAGQAASLGTTALPVASVSAGLWRVSYFARITTVAGVSSSLTVTMSYTTGSIAQSDSGAAMTGNTTATHQFGTLVIRVDADTPISYSTTYASNAAGAMRYSLDLACEALALD
jgi:hypothetical protein